MIAEGDGNVELEPEAYAAGIEGEAADDERDDGYKARCYRCEIFWPIPGELVPILLAPGARKFFAALLNKSARNETCVGHASS